MSVTRAMQVGDEVIPRDDFMNGNGGFCFTTFSIVD